jgi:hypothetical protein
MRFLSLRMALCTLVLTAQVPTPSAPKRSTCTFQTLYPSARPLIETAIRHVGGGGVGVSTAYSRGRHATSSARHTAEGDMRHRRIGRSTTTVSRSRRRSRSTMLVHAMHCAFACRANVLPFDLLIIKRALNVRPPSRPASFTHHPIVTRLFGYHALFHGHATLAMRFGISP